MSLHPQVNYQVPEETARVARSVFPKENIYITIYDSFGVLFEDEEFVALYPHDGQPALSPVRLSLVLIMQFVEGLSDRQAANAVRSRIDWKYLLCLELDDPGFHYSVLSEFRARLLEGKAEQLLFEKMLSHFQDKGLLKKRGKQRTDSTNVVGAIRSLNRIELVGETLRHALNALAVVAPDWMLAHSQLEWLDRYGPRVNDYRLPTSQSERITYAEQIGVDGLILLTTIWNEPGRLWLRELPAVQTLWQVWIQNFTWKKDGSLRWREAKELPPASLAIRSPYDGEARFAKKRSTSWVGYKVHLTETCDETTTTPQLITHVETTEATVTDVVVTDTIHQALEAKGCLPDQHIVDRGYVEAELLVTSQDLYGIELIGPMRNNTSWQSRRENGFEAKDFTIDWENLFAICPSGAKSIHWMPAINNKGKPVIQIIFSKHDCRPCPSQSECTRADPPRRSITVLPEAHYKALLAAREYEKTEDFAETYARRAGVEGTISQGVRRCGLRQARYVGLAKTHLQHLLSAMAINLVRTAQWLAGHTPAQTRQSAFLRLHASSLAP